GVQGVARCGPLMGGGLEGGPLVLRDDRLRVDGRQLEAMAVAVARRSSRGERGQPSARQPGRSAAAVCASGTAMPVGDGAEYRERAILLVGWGRLGAGD